MFALGMQLPGAKRIYAPGGPPAPAPPIPVWTPPAPPPPAAAQVYAPPVLQAPIPPPPPPRPPIEPLPQPKPAPPPPPPPQIIVTREIVVKQEAIALPTPVHREATLPVTIVVTTYNDHALAVHALESCLEQKASQLILMDDASNTTLPPDLACMVAKYGVEYIRHGENRGLAAARNTAFTLARNEWVLPLDADDTLHQKAVERLYEHREGTDVVCGNISIEGHIHYPPGANHIDKATGLCKFTRADWREENHLFCSSLIRWSMWESVGGYPTEDEREQFEDWRFWARCFNYGAKFKCVPVLCYEHADTPSGMCHRLEARKDYFRTLAAKGLGE